MLHQSDEALLSDESFINYCLERNEADINRWTKILQDNPGEAVRMDELRAIVMLTSRDIQDIELRYQITDLEKKIALFEEASVATTNTTFKNRTKRWNLAVAACMALLAGIAIYYLVNSVQRSEALPLLYATKPAEKKALILPDGSRVILNADSKVTLHADFGQKDRRLQLDGEAYFDVVHNPSKPFIVETPRMDVKVLGTAFNVKAYQADDLFETSLIRGSVELSLKKEHKTVMLRPHEKYVLREIRTEKVEAVISSNTAATHSNTGLLPVKINKIDTSVVEVSWTNNKIVFVDESLAEVMKKLERWYGVRIVVQDEALANNLYTGSFRNESIEDVLSALQFSKAFTYKKQGNVIMIDK